jgi:hypothetical protein
VLALPFILFILSTKREPRAERWQSRAALRVTFRGRVRRTVSPRVRADSLTDHGFPGWTAPGSEPLENQ